MALLRSARQQIQSGQIGNMVPPAARVLMDEERSYLLRVAKAARDAQQPQIALNSVTRAQTLEAHHSSTVVEEFSSVLWMLSEQKVAIESLKQLVASKAVPDNDDSSRRAQSLARLVSNISSRQRPIPD
jgi:ataxia telangiectasia mutated family protein